MTTLLYFVPIHFALLDVYFIVGSILHIYAHVHPSEILTEIHHKETIYANIYYSAPCGNAANALQT